MSETSVLAPIDRRDLANQVSARVQLRDVRLSSLRARSDASPNVEMRYNVNLSHGATAVWDAAAGILTVTARFLFKAEQDAEKQTVDPITVESSFTLRYDLAEHASLSRENFDAFAEVNGVFNAWPYWRELLQTTLTRMGFPAFTLPVMRIG